MICNVYNIFVILLKNIFKQNVIFVIGYYESNNILYLNINI